MNQNDLRTVYQTFVGTGALFAGTFKSRNTDGVTFTSFSLQNLRRRPIDKEQRLLGGMLSARTTVIEAWQDDLDTVSAPEPKINDEFVDDASDTWIIEDIDWPLQKQLHRCTCKKAKA